MNPGATEICDVIEQAIGQDHQELVGREVGVAELVAELTQGFHQPLEVEGVEAAPCPHVAGRLPVVVGVWRFVAADGVGHEILEVAAADLERPLDPGPLGVRRGHLDDGSRLGPAEGARAHGFVERGQLGQLSTEQGELAGLAG